MTAETVSALLCQSRTYSRLLLHSGKNSRKTSPKLNSAINLWKVINQRINKFKGIIMKTRIMLLNIAFLLSMVGICQAQESKKDKLEKDPNEQTSSSETLHKRKIPTVVRLRGPNPEETLPIGWGAYSAQ